MSIVAGGGKTLAAAAQMAVNKKTTQPATITVKPTTNPLAGESSNT